MLNGLLKVGSICWHEKIIKDHLDKIKSALEPVISKQLFETCNDLASSRQLRERVGKEIQDALPEGCHFTINEAGFCQITLPLHVTTQISPEMVTELRNKTNNSLKECKTALQKCSGDILLAEGYLKYNGCAVNMGGRENYKKWVMEMAQEYKDSKCKKNDNVKYGEKMKEPLKFDGEICDEEHEEDESPYCPECGACGIDGCCSALMCAYNNMVINGHGDYCENYYWDLVIAKEALEKLTEKHLKEIDYRGILDKVFKEREAHNRKIEPWMELTKWEIIDLHDEDWEHYKKGGCLCAAHGDCECICGAWRKK